MASVWGELKRRNVVRVAVAYVIIAWLILQVGDTLASALRLTDWVNTVLAFFLILGFPLAMFFAWAFEITPEGLKKEKDIDRSESITHIARRKLDFMIIGMLVVALGYFAFDKFVLDPSRDAELVKATTKAVTEQAAETADKSIAVLAFVNMSEDPDNEYFSDGISEEILNLLAKIPELRVTSRTSAFSFKGQNLDVPTMAARLNVAYVLEGSVRKSGNQFRITAQLIEAVTDSHLWSETYNFELEDIFAIQDEIAESVVGALKIQLLGEAPRTDTTSPEAYALYLQSIALEDQWTGASLLQAESVVLRVLEIDSTYVPAWMLLALIYQGGSGNGAWQPHEAFSKSRAAAMEALRLDPGNAKAHVTLSAIAATYDYDLETARKEQELASTLAPRAGFVLRNAAMLARIDGDFSESNRLLKEVEIIDPVSLLPKMLLGNNYFRMGRLAEAKSAYAEALELRPTGNTFNFSLGSIMLISGNLDDALSQMNKATRDGYRLAGRAMVLYAMGDTSSAATELESLIAIGDTWTYEIAQVHAYFGNLDESFRWLHRAIDRRDQSLTLMTGDPFLDNLRDDPRLDDVLERLGRKVH
ncbi:MAG: tetratricopeptide repeat protein [Proteobacteria bacterium]|nr:tetratricopeptide repeat protein [Pseudomonadota bacterium]